MSRTGIEFGEALALLFIALKLAEVIHWSWWWVLSPLWVPLVVAAAWFVVGLLWAAINYAVQLMLWWAR